MQEVIRELRAKLRLAMNGIVSTSMREKGVEYKLNFGVSLPKIREIASGYNKDADLAQLLWKEDVRELKILATLLQPVETFQKAQAEAWVKEIRHQEIAELYNLHLLQYTPYAEEIAVEWIMKEDEYYLVVGFLLYTRLFTKSQPISQEHATQFLSRAKEILDSGISRMQRAALTACKRYGRQSAEKAAEVLNLFVDYKESESLEKQEFYNDLKFEFEYYL